MENWEKLDAQRKWNTWSYSQGKRKFNYVHYATTVIIGLIVFLQFAGTFS